METETFAKIEKIFQDVFDDPQLRIDESDSPDTIADWDSFTNIQLLAAIEEAFGIKFTTDEASGIHSVGELFVIIMMKID